MNFFNQTKVNGSEGYISRLMPKYKNSIRKISCTLFNTTYFKTSRTTLNGIRTCNLLAFIHRVERAQNSGLYATGFKVIKLAPLSLCNFDSVRKAERWLRGLC